MLTIHTFNINQQENNLTLLLADSSAKFNENWQFSFEFLRVIRLPNQQATKQTQVVESHKKDAQLISVESVAKHGFKLIFDDGFSCCYHQDEFALLNQQRDLLWQGYLDALKASGHNRQATIDIKQL